MTPQTETPTQAEPKPQAKAQTPPPAPETPTSSKKREKQASQTTEEYTRNDAGRALRFVDRFFDSRKTDIRYVPEMKCWLIWQEHFWKVDNDGAIVRLAIDHSRELFAEAARMENLTQREVAGKEAIMMGVAKNIQSMLTLARCDNRVVVHRTQLDANLFLLGVENGVIELRTGTFRPGRREDLITKQAGTHYEAGADCPRWKKFLEEVQGGNTETIEFLQKFVGYSLTGDISEHCLAFLYGDGCNGKSTFMEVLQKLAGNYGQRASQDLIITHPSGNEPKNDIARLYGARLVIGSEVGEGCRLAEDRVKNITGGDTLCGRQLYQESFEFTPSLKLWVYGNHKFGIFGTDYGIWRRIRLIPFTVKIAPEQIDSDLPNILAAEMPGILNWALEGVKKWQKDGLKAPAVVKEAGAEFRSEEDILGEFLEEETTVCPDGRVSRADLLALYEAWSKRTSQNHRFSNKAFTKRMRERFKEKHFSNGWYWVGISINPPHPLPIQPEDEYLKII